MSRCFSPPSSTAIFGISHTSWSASHHTGDADSTYKSSKAHTPPVRPDENLEVGAALEEIQRVLDSPLAALVGTEEERGEAAELIRQAVARCWPVLAEHEGFSYTLSVVPALSTSPYRADARTVREVVARHGGVASTADLRSELGLSERTLYRRLGELVADGSLYREGRSRYTTRRPTVAVSGEALQIVRVIERLDAEAHLSGYDILAGFAHQFTFDYPHLVCCHPPHFDGLVAALVSKRFVVLAAGPGALRGPLMSRTVLLRRQPLIEQETLVRGSLATPEKAWVDLLRETRRSQLAIDYGELGRLLRAMTEYGVNQRALASYARRIGYLQWLKAATGQCPPTGVNQRQLAAGHAA